MLRIVGQDHAGVAALQKRLLDRDRVVVHGGSWAASVEHRNTLAKSEPLGFGNRVLPVRPTRFAPASPVGNPAVIALLGL
jgi:hypothetical protein